MNECLEAGPSLLPMLMDVLFRFRLKKVVLITDIEKAFLNVSRGGSSKNFDRLTGEREARADLVRPRA